MLRTSLAAFAAALLVQAASAQLCGPGQTFFKNDVLPVNPGTHPVSVIQGLCEGEAMGCVFNVASVGPQVRVRTAAVGYIQAGSVNGTQALVNLQIYDGVTWAGGVPTLGPLVFDFGAATAGSIGVTSTAINTVDLTNFNIPISSGKLVVVWEMDFNPIGQCSSGYLANFATDYPSGLANCSVTQKNLMRIQGQGWVDAATATVLGFPLCPGYYAGNWLIRACVEPVGPATPFCFGDGSLATPCPCGNNGLVGSGCENSSATGGAQLAAAGTTNPDTLVMTSTGSLASSFGILVQGDTNLPTGVPFGDGIRCAGGVLKRLYVKLSDGAGTTVVPQGGDPSITAASASLGDTISPGSTRYYQYYYRDPVPTFCAIPTGNNYNISGGVIVVW